MCVAGENGGYFQRSCFRQASWIVREQECRTRRTSDHSRDVARPARPETNPGQFQRFSAHAQSSPCVIQHRDPAFRQCLRDRALVVVVAKDREYALRRLQLRQQLGYWSDVCAIAEGDVVASQDDEIGSLCHDEVHRPLDV
jgi:hypothetical protein